MYTYNILYVYIYILQLKHIKIIYIYIIIYIYECVLLNLWVVCFYANAIDMSSQLLSQVRPLYKMPSIVNVLSTCAKLKTQENLGRLLHVHLYTSTSVRFPRCNRCSRCRKQYQHQNLPEPAKGQAKSPAPFRFNKSQIWQLLLHAASLFWTILQSASISNNPLRGTVIHLRKSS